MLVDSPGPASITIFLPNKFVATLMQEKGWVMI
jgi:hypothetical protein